MFILTLVNTQNNKDLIDIFPEWPIMTSGSHNLYFLFGMYIVHSLTSRSILYSTKEDFKRSYLCQKSLDLRFECHIFYDFVLCYDQKCEI